jgi:hypothetical protein
MTRASLLALLAQLMAGGSAVVCLVGAVVSNEWWLKRKRTLSAYLQPKQIVDSKNCGLVLIVAAVCCYLSIVSNLFFANDEYSGQDEEAYLVTAFNAEGRGGPASILGDLYRGEFSEANQHPLYIALLSNSPTFRNGKLLSVLIGLASLILVAYLSVRSLDWFRAGVLCVLLATNMAFCRFSVIIGCEGLLLLIVSLIWFHAPRVVRSLEGNCKRQLTINAAVVGGLLALGWLTKGTGLLLLAGYVVWLLSLCLKRGTTGLDQKIRPAWRTVAGFAVVLLVAWTVTASPLLARNSQRFGSLFYNVNSWLMFVDEYSDPTALADQYSISEAAQGYLETHSVAQIASRETQGLVWESFILIRMLGPAPFDEFRIIPGLLVAGLAFLGILISRESRARLLLIWGLICLLMFAWYVPVAAGERFGFPLMIPVLMYAATGIAHVVESSRMKIVTGLLVSLSALVAISTWMADLTGRI